MSDRALHNRPDKFSPGPIAQFNTLFTTLITDQGAAVNGAAPRVT